MVRERPVLRRVRTVFAAFALRALSALPALAALACAASPGCGRKASAPGAVVYDSLGELVGADVTEITLRWEDDPVLVDTPDHRERTVRITDPSEIAQLLSIGPLRATVPCPCIHSESAIFHTPEGDSRALFCEECFDFLRGKERFQCLATPPEFYAIFRERIGAEPSGP